MWQLKEYWNVFCGNEMVYWLLMIGLVCDRSQAEKYGKRLLDGGIINHVDVEEKISTISNIFTRLPSVINVCSICKEIT